MNFVFLEGRDNGIDKWTDPAEAAWKSTIAAINLLLNMKKRQHDIETDVAALRSMEQIIAAWPEELL